MVFVVFDIMPYPCIERARTAAKIHNIMDISKNCSQNDRRGGQASVGVVMLISAFECEVRNGESTSVVGVGVILTSVSWYSTQR